MTISNFDKRLIIEQIRYIEAQDSLSCDTKVQTSDLSLHDDFENRLWQRAQCLIQQYDLSQAIGRAARLSRYAKTVALLVALLLGVMGILYSVTDSQTINIYWLLLVLLGFNFISMLLWLAGIVLNMEGLIAGALARLTSLLPAYLDNKTDTHGQTVKSASRQADKAWLVCHFRGAVGKWQLSKITHQLWLTYLLAGLVFLVLLLTVRQYDFVWGTTLLSDSAFIKLTDVLSAPLQAIGFVTPSLNEVQETRIGAMHNDVAQILNAAHRNHWAQFLLGALLCFGLVPRLLFWLWSAIMCRYARRRFALDYYLPYYIALRQKLIPLASHGKIIDADTAQPVDSQVSANTFPQTPMAHALPANSQWVAVELGDSITWPLPSMSQENNLGKVSDRASLTRIVQRLQQNHYPVIAVAVSSARIPDRGVQRTIASLMAHSEQRWLVLLQEPNQVAVSTARLSAWYRLAETCKVPADHVISMSVI